MTPLNVFLAHPYAETPSVAFVQQLTAYMAAKQPSRRVLVHPGFLVFRRYPQCRNWKRAPAFLLGADPGGRVLFDAFVATTPLVATFTRDLLRGAQQRGRVIGCWQGGVLRRVTAIVDLAEPTQKESARLVLAPLPPVG